MTDIEFEHELRAALIRHAETLVIPQRSAPVTRIGRPRRVWPTLAGAAAIVAGLAAIGAQHLPVPSLASAPPTGAEPETPKFTIQLRADGTTLTVPDPVSAIRNIGPGTGPQAIVLRDVDGTFAYHTAMVSYPVVPLPSEVGGKPGVVSPYRYRWQLGRFTAEIRGDLGHDELVRLADLVRVDGDRAVITPPDRYRRTFDGIMGPTWKSEQRYSTGQFASLGGDVLGVGSSGGLVFAEVSNNVGVEWDLLLSSTHDLKRADVDGHSAALAGIANGAWAWEIQPGVYAIVGWSGSRMSESNLGVMARIASTATVEPASGSVKMTIPPGS